MDNEKEAEVTEGATPDPFDTAFNEAAEAEEKDASESQKPTGGEKKEEEKKVEEVKKEEADGTDKSAAAPEKKEEVPEKPAVSKEDFEKLNQQYKSLQGMYNSLVGKVNEATKTPAKADEGKDTPPVTTLDDKFFDDLYSDLSKAEKDIVGQIDGEFDVITKAVDIKTAHALKKTVQAVQKATTELMTTELKKLALAAKKRMDDIESKVVKSEDDAHFDTVKGAHPDYQKYVDDGSLSTWIDSLSPSKKKAYTTIYNEGEASEVIDMFDEFKEVKGITKAEKKEEKTDKDEPPAKTGDDKVRQLESLKGKTTGVNATGVGSQKAQDYESSWDEAMRGSG